MRIEEVSEEFKTAINEVAAYIPTISEDVRVPGYGMVSPERAHKEIKLAHDVAQEHAAKGNHLHAAMQYERAAMFHRALHQHGQTQAEAHVGSMTQRTDLMVPEAVVPKVQKGVELTEGVKAKKRLSEFRGKTVSGQKANVIDTDPKINFATRRKLFQTRGL
jgi:hypothetical protein